MSATQWPTVLADLGGSNARFALSNPSGDGFSAELCLTCADFPGPQQALQHYLRQQGGLNPSAICIAVAGPVAGPPGEQSVRMTNHPWHVDARELSRFYGGIPVRLLNDFAAVAWSVPLLAEADVSAIGPRGHLPYSQADYTIGLIGPGTGLGVSGLMFRDGRYYPIAGEGGHVGLAPENPQQVEVWRALHELLGPDQRIYQERLLSGPGVEVLYQVMGQLYDQAVDRLEVAAIFQRAADATDPVASDSISLFFEILGQAAGNQALTIGAFQGVCIAGGIVPRYPELLRASRFRAGFENKGTYRALMETIPTVLIEHPQPGLLGAAFFARRMRLADTPN